MLSNCDEARLVLHYCSAAKCSQAKPNENQNNKKQNIHLFKKYSEIKEQALISQENAKTNQESRGEYAQAAGNTALRETHIRTHTIINKQKHISLRNQYNYNLNNLFLVIEQQ